MPRRGGFEALPASTDDRHVTMESIPSLLSFLICDMIIIEAGTKKKTLVGVFDAVNAQRVLTPVRVGLYARLTDMEGTYAFKIHVVHLG